jgi:hypothetical protein
MILFEKTYKSYTNSNGSELGVWRMVELVIIYFGTFGNMDHSTEAPSNRFYYIIEKLLFWKHGLFYREEAVD